MPSSGSNIAIAILNTQPLRLPPQGPHTTKADRRVEEEPVRRRKGLRGAMRVNTIMTYRYIIVKLRYM